MVNEIILSLKIDPLEKETAVLCIVKSNLGTLDQIRETFLHPEEEKVFSSFSFDLRKESYLLGRFSTKKALEKYHQGRHAKNYYWVANGPMKEPLLKNGNAQVAISHSTPYGVSLVGPHLAAFGVDIEIKENVEKINSSFFEKNECNLFKNCNSKCALWTAKEALIKLFKVGFTIPLELLTISSLEQKDDLQICSFEHFPEFQALLFDHPCFMLAIACHQSICLTELNRDSWKGFFKEIGGI